MAFSLLEFFPDDFQINVLDVGAALISSPPYQSLVDAGRARIYGFEPDSKAANLPCSKTPSAFWLAIGCSLIV